MLAYAHVYLEYLYNKIFISHIQTYSAIIRVIMLSIDVQAVNIFLFHKKKSFFMIFYQFWIYIFVNYFFVLTTNVHF